MVVIKVYRFELKIQLCLDPLYYELLTQPLNHTQKLYSTNPITHNKDHLSQCPTYSLKHYQQNLNQLTGVRPIKGSLPYLRNTRH